MTQQIKKIRALILFRLLVSYLLLAVFFLYGNKFSIFLYPTLLSTLAAFVFLITIVYLLILKKLKRRFYLFSLFQILFDILLINFLLIVTGGVESWFSFLLLVNVIGGGIVLGRKSLMVIASLSSISYGCVIELQFYGIIPVPYSLTLQGEDFFYNIFANITALFLIAYLSRYLLLGIEQTSEDLQRAESSFRDLSALHKEVIENIPSGLAYTDPEGRIVLFNKAAQSITNSDSSQATEKSLMEIFPFLGPAIRKGSFKGTIDDGETQKIVEMTISEHRNSVQALMGFVASFQDVTRMEEMEKDMKEKEKLAAIGELSANIAHEIRNPLAALRTSVEMLREGDLTEARNCRIMDIAIHEMDRLNKIITDFLIYTNPRPPDLKQVNLNRIILETVDLLRAAAADRQDVVINHHLNGEVLIKADEDRLRQVFWNLGLNALQSFPGPGCLDIAVKRTRSSVTVSFKDNGCGIPAEAMEKIFYPFFTTKKEGSGLGLSMVYRIIKDHGGIINVASAQGRGTSFDITLREEP